MDTLTGFVVGFGFGLWVWVLLLGGLSLIFFSTYRDRIGLATIGFVLIVTSLILAYGRGVFDYLVNHPLQIVGVFVGYFVLGALWSIFKWGRYVSKKREKYDEEFRDMFAKDPSQERSLNDNDMERWRTYVQSRHLIPAAWYNKERITSWIAFWPWSLVVYFLADLIIDLLHAIWRRLLGIYDANTNRYFGNIDPRILK